MKGNSMTSEEHDALIERMKKYAGCSSCNSYGGAKCRACTWDDAMDCVDDFFDEIDPAEPEDD